jgi:hypothetical protein
MVPKRKEALIAAGAVATAGFAAFRTFSAGDNIGGSLNVLLVLLTLTLAIILAKESRE